MFRRKSKTVIPKYEVGEVVYDLYHGISKITSRGINNSGNVEYFLNDSGLSVADHRIRRLPGYVENLHSRIEAQEKDINKLTGFIEDIVDCLPSIEFDINKKKFYPLFCNSPITLYKKVGIKKKSRAKSK